MHFEHALAGHDAMGAPLFAVRTRLEWGRALARRREGARARPLLEQACDDARAICCPGLEERASEALAEGQPVG